jgi:diketogulonate reductase-like aldo/keto reductase
MQELSAVITRLGASACATNQVYFSLSERGPEFSLLPWMRERAMPLMAYSPIDQGSLAGDDTLAQIGQERGLTAAQVALAWVVSRPGVAAIPKASSVRHLQENLDAEGVSLSDDELRRIDKRFAPPKKKTPLSMI